MNIGVTYDSIILSKNGVTTVSGVLNAQSCDLGLAGRGLSLYSKIILVGLQKVHRVVLASGQSLVVGTDTSFYTDDPMPIPAGVEVGMKVQRFIGRYSVSGCYPFEPFTKEWEVVDRLLSLKTNEYTYALHAGYGFSHKHELSRVLAVLYAFGYDASCYVNSQGELEISIRKFDGFVEDTVVSIDNLEVPYAELVNIVNSADDYTIVNGVLLKAN